MPEIYYRAPIRGFEAKTLPPDLENLFAQLIAALSAAKSRITNLSKDLQAIVSDASDCITVVKTNATSPRSDALVTLWPIGDRVVMEVYDGDVFKQPNTYANLLNGAVIRATSGT